MYMKDEEETNVYSLDELEKAFSEGAEEIYLFFGMPGLNDYQEKEILSLLREKGYEIVFGNRWMGKLTNLKVCSKILKIREDLKTEAKKIFENSLNFIDIKMDIDMDLTEKEIIVLILKTRSDESSYYTDNQIAEFLNIEPEKVSEIVKKYFTKYKESLNMLVNNYMNHIIENEYNKEDLGEIKPVYELTPLTVMILMLKFGCIDKKYYSSEEISKFLNIPALDISHFTENYILERENVFGGNTKTIIQKIAYNNLDKKTVNVV